MNWNEHWEVAETFSSSFIYESSNESPLSVGWISTLIDQDVDWAERCSAFWDLVGSCRSLPSQNQERCKIERKCDASGMGHRQTT